GKDIEKIYQQIKEIISKEVQNMTHLDVIEINANVTDIQSKEEFDAKQETVQDKVTNAAKNTDNLLLSKRIRRNKRLLKKQNKQMTMTPKLNNEQSKIDHNRT